MQFNDDRVLQLERMSRHFASAISSYDKISLLDLAHSMRVLCDQKTRIDDLLADRSIQIQLPAARPSTSLQRKHQRRYDYFWLRFPGGVPRDDIELSELLLCRGGSFGSRKSFQYDRNALVFCRRFTDWLALPFVEFHRLPDGESGFATISREVLIRRVSNLFGGSHPHVHASDEIGSKYDKYVVFLHGMESAGAPATYYALLNIAFVIDQGVTRALKPKVSNGASATPHK